MKAIVYAKNGPTYDIVFDTLGKSLFAGCIKSLKKKGNVVIIVQR
jgi:NADPH:quinone reductase-like Zn-dependent oxidoreductase